MLLYQLFLSAAVAGLIVVAFGLFKVFQFLFHQWSSPLRHFPGPPSPSWFYGNMKQIFGADNSVLHEQWVKEYGHTIKYKGFFHQNRLYTVDTKAINYVLSHTDNFQKPEQARYNLTRVLGPGILVVEGDKHREQRKIMNPAFGPVRVRALTSIFVAKAMQLRDVLSAEISKNKADPVSADDDEKTSHEDSSDKDKGVRIEVLSWLSRTTLDIIGLAGFNYRFDALNTTNTPNELNQAFVTMFKASQEFTLLPFLQATIPALRVIPTKQGRAIATAQKTMNRIANQLFTDAKTSSSKPTSVEKSDVVARDLFSLLVKANLKEGQKMLDEDVLAQVPTFLVAGHETTSVATTWALYALSLDPDIQSKLRTELLSVQTQSPTMDDLNALPYLDAVIRETLRIHSPVPGSIRVAIKDDVIPLNKPFVDKRGVVHEAIPISKGDPIFIPILAINRSKELWGEDALEFNPERWNNLPEAVSGIPGVWGNILSFLGGPRACIGYRFSLVEIKALLFALVRSFEFELAVPSSDIAKRQSIVQRPIVLSEKEQGHQLPLLVKVYVGGDLA